MNQIPSIIFRHRALEAIKPVMSVLIVLALLAQLPTLIGSLVIMRTEATPASYIEPVQEEMNELSDEMLLILQNTLKLQPAATPGKTPAASPDAATEPAVQGDAAAETAGAAAQAPTEEELDARMDAAMERYHEIWGELLTALATFVREKGLIYFSMLALELLLAPILAALLQGGLQDALCGREVTLAGALPRLKLAPKALGLSLWVMVRCGAWALPGVAAMLLGVLMAYAPVQLAGGPVAILMDPALMGLPSLMCILMGSLASLALLFGGMGFAAVLYIRAYFHYHLAPVALVDKPDLGMNGCIHASWKVMRHRKMERFLLYISFALWMLLRTCVSMMCLMMFGSVLGMALGMMADLFLGVYMGATESCFYLIYTKGEKLLKMVFEQQQEDGGLN